MAQSLVKVKFNTLSWRNWALYLPFCFVYWAKYMPNRLPAWSMLAYAKP
jgi:hypothetical protein